MSKTSTLTAAVAAITLFAGALAAGPAEAKKFKSGKALAIIGTSIVVGSAIAAARAYREDDDDYHYSHCFVTERYNHYTDEYEDVQVCRAPY